MRKLILLSAFILIGFAASAQGTPDSTDEVKKVIMKLFDGMRKGDSSMVKSSFSEGMIMQTISNRNGNIEVRTDKAAGFLKAVGTPHQEVWDERIKFDQVLIDSNLASVWTSYQFYVGDKFSHCGVNSFQLVKGNNGWKIVHLIDTRRKDNCIN
jgi:hypothetical protein